MDQLYKDYRINIYRCTMKHMIVISPQKTISQTDKRSQLYFGIPRIGYGQKRKDQWEKFANLFNVILLIVVENTNISSSRPK